MCPVRLSLLGGVVNVYPRCAPVPAAREHEAPMLPYGGDRKLDNLGLLAGRVVWLDYDGSWNGCSHSPGGRTRASTDAHFTTEFTPGHIRFAAHLDGGFALTEAQAERVEAAMQATVEAMIKEVVVGDG